MLALDDGTARHVAADDIPSGLVAANLIALDPVAVDLDRLARRGFPAALEQRQHGRQRRNRSGYCADGAEVFGYEQPDGIHVAPPSRGNSVSASGVRRRLPQP